MEPSSGGSGEVHAHVSSHPDKGDGMSGKFDADTGSHGSRAQSGTGGVRDRAERVVSGARARGDEFRDRAGAAAKRARNRADHLVDEAEERLERTGALNTARDNPVAVLGVAFALGFLLAGDGDDDDQPRHPALSKAKNQVKGAIMGGISAAISQQLRTFIEEQGGLGALLAGLGVPVPGGRDQPYFTPDDELHDT